MCDSAWVFTARDAQIWLSERSLCADAFWVMLGCGFVWKCWVYSQWNSPLIGIMIDYVYVYIYMGLSENVVYPIVANGFADHYPYEKWLAIIGGIPYFQTNPCGGRWTHLYSCFLRITMNDMFFTILDTRIFVFIVCTSIEIIRDHRSIPSRVSHWNDPEGIWILIRPDRLMNHIWLVVTGTWLDYDFSYIGNDECHHPNWRTHVFQRGRSTTNQDRWFISFLICFSSIHISYNQW